MSDCAYMGGYSGHPKKHGDSNTLRVDAAGIAYRGLRELFRIPWSAVNELIVDGPDQAARRITVTRLATIGVFALGAQKKSRIAVLIVELDSGEQAVFHTKKLTALELRGKLAPVISQLNAAAKRKAALPRGRGTDETRRLERRPGFSVADELRKLKQLCDEGVLTEEQFAAQRDKLLGV